MVATNPPNAPESLPAYLADGLPKQDSATLTETQSFIDELLAHRDRHISAEELPEAADPVDDGAQSKGTLVKERVKCGDGSCHCMSGGKKHGPYLYRYFREGGRLKSEYVGKPGSVDG